MTKSNRITAILLVVVFVLPVILAKLALDNDWFNKGSTNRGELMEPPLDVSALISDQEPSWRILYVMPDQCDVKCKNALYSLEQVWTALGRLSDRATATVIVTENSGFRKQSCGARKVVQGAESMVLLRKNKDFQGRATHTNFSGSRSRQHHGVIKSFFHGIRSSGPFDWSIPSVFRPSSVRHHS